MPDLDAAARLGRPADQQAELLLLHDVAYAGTPIPGERAHALLALLALSGGAGVADDDLVRDVWPDRQPVNPRKALQVLVSRVRAHTARGLVERVGTGTAWQLRPPGSTRSCCNRWSIERPGPRTTATWRQRPSWQRAHGPFRWVAPTDRWESFVTVPGAPSSS